MEGCDINCENASLNGVYALIPGGFNNTYAYKKVCNNADPFFVFYSLAKKQWEINDQLDDSTRGFAYARTHDGGKTAPPELGSELRWWVFDKKGHGYKQDPTVQCKAFVKNVAETNTAASTEQDEEQQATEHVKCMPKDVVDHRKQAVDRGVPAARTSRKMMTQESTAHPSPNSSLGMETD